MSKREYAAMRMREYKDGSFDVDEEAVLNAIIEAVREEIPEWTFSAKIRPAEPQLTQGYTAEQWQEIIDGGYLCEVSMFAEYTSSHFTVLKELRKGTTHDFVIPHFINNATCYSHCRPAQIKGVMRPIFVEPVDKDAHCIFINDIDGAISGCQRWNSFVKILTNGKWGSIFKYIEL